MVYIIYDTRFIAVLVCFQIIKIRAQIERIDISDESLQALSEVGVKTTLRWVVTSDRTSQQQTPFCTDILRTSWTDHFLYRQVIMATHFILYWHPKDIMDRPFSILTGRYGNTLHSVLTSYRRYGQTFFVPTGCYGNTLQDRTLWQNTPSHVLLTWEGRGLITRT